MKKINSILVLVLLSSFGFCQTTQEGIVNGWNYVVTLPANYNQTTVNYPTTIFFPGTGEVGTDINRLKQNGPHAYITPTVNPLPGFIVISLQPVSLWPNELQINNRIELLKLLFRIDANRINLTGLSMGGWCSSTYTTGGFPYARTVVTVQGVVPDDNQPYPQLFSSFMGRYLCLEQINDGRDGGTIVNYLNSLRPGTAWFIQTNFSGGGHCCWEQFYGKGSTQPQRFLISGRLMTIYEFMIEWNKLNVLAIDTTGPIRPIKPAQLYFDNTTIYFKASIITDWTLHNIVGQVVRKGTMRPGNNKIPLIGLPVGMYYLRTQFNQNHKIFKY